MIRGTYGYRQIGFLIFIFFFLLRDIRPLLALCGGSPVRQVRVRQILTKLRLHEQLRTSQSLVHNPKFRNSCISIVFLLFTVS